MKKPLLLLLSVLTASVLSCGKDNKAPRQVHSEFATKIAGVLPPGWSLQEAGDDIMLTRKDPVTLFVCVAMDLSVTRDEQRFRQYVNENSVITTYRIRLHRGATLEPSERSRLSAVNDQIVVTKSTQIKGREFYADDAMRSYHSSYRELPEYYDDRSSIYVATTVGPYECAYPRIVAEECDNVRRSLDSLFNRYSDDSHRRSLSYGIW
jgi:hypothetical protein